MQAEGLRWWRDYPPGSFDNPPLFWAIFCKFRPQFRRLAYWKNLFGWKRGFCFWAGEWAMRLKTPLRNFRGM